MELPILLSTWQDAAFTQARQFAKQIVFE